MSTSILEALPGKLDIKRHSPSIFYIYLQDYKRNARQAWGVNSFQDGEEYYKACLKWHLSVDMTPEEVHEKGLQEVDRIYKKMKMVQLMSYSMTFEPRHEISNYVAF